MPILDIQGKQVEVDDSFLRLSPEQQNATVDEIAEQIGIKPHQPVQLDGRDPQAAAMADMSQMTTGFQNAPQEDTDRFVRANLEASKINEMQGERGLMRRAADATSANLPFADEMYSGTVGGVARMARDGVGYGEAYKREQALQAALKEKRGTAANLIGDVAGGIALGAGVTSGPLTMGGGGTVAASRPAWGGATLMGRASGTGGKLAAGMGEGAAYGGLYGAANAEEGKRLEEAAKGSALGALTGGVFETGGNVLSRLRAPKATTPAPGVDELASASHALYEKSRAAGIAIKPGSFDKLANNVAMAAGRPNPTLRPNTLGIIDDVASMKGKPVDLQTLDELQQSVRMAMKNAQPQDKFTLDRVQKVINHYSDNVNATDITGDIRGFGYVKDARKLWAQKSKTQTIEDLLDLADVDTGKYTQSGMANTIRQRMSQLYSQIKKGKATSGWSHDEIALIRQMAKGGSNSQMVNWLSKLAPRGVISASLPQTVGATSTLALGPAGLLINAAAPIAGHLAGRAADRGAVTAANSLRDAAARGFVYRAPQLPNHLRRAISGATAGATELQ
ncbi:hypothetical protein QFZ34_003263 [Phyllobacterium ifriqiyense]|uniref:Uncharacterized protein n=1 Tax=Phyllobacterium ifriqiyense TaxID=314238 RepID=A0ABU0SBN5_9HYPH|nr:hypothetical protein [Phyllobacterium ifriqiyense]MDQ0998081.1 hypothetical protein [Phyllobacterium ifriqiyense]